MLTEAEAILLQEQLRPQLIMEDQFSEPLELVAGADVEYDKSSDIICGAIVVLQRTTLQVVASATHCMKVAFPYIPGLFSFREMPPLLEAYRKLQTRPQVLICDAQGLAHPRRFGLACHLGLELSLPAVGCAKTKLYGYLQHAVPAQRGATAGLLAEDNNEPIGLALRTQSDINPVYISVGHKISLSTAAALVLELATQYRLPETTRLADQYAREALRAFLPGNQQ